jgi:hypothetical protein
MNESNITEVAEAVVGRADVMSPSWSTASVVLMALVALAVWAASHFARRRFKLPLWQDLPLLFIRVFLGTVTLWMVFSVISRIGNLELATTWSMWTTSALAAICIEIIIAFYNLERQIVARRMGLILVSLRTAMVLLLALMLVQPVLSKRIFEDNERFVVVLMDESTSMDIIDNVWNDSEKLRLVEALSPGLVKRNYSLEQITTALDPIREELLAEGESLASLSGGSFTSSAEPNEMRRESLSKLITKAVEAVTTQSSQLKQALADQQFDGPARADVELLHERLVTRVENRLREAQQLLEGTAAANPDALDAAKSLQPIATQIREAATELWGVLGQVPKVAERIDHDFLAALSDEKRQEIEAVVAKSRASIAQAILLGQGESKPGLIDQIMGKNYTVRVYLYSSNVAPIEVDEWKKQLAGETDKSVSGKPDTAPDQSANDAVDGGMDDRQQVKSLDRSRQTTDLAGALAKLRDDIPSEKLSSVIVVSDGRFNGPVNPDALVRQLAAEGTSVSSLVIGSSRAPMDAAISSVDLPKSVLTDDLLSVEAVINVTGMKGGKVVVKLLDKAREKTLDEKTVKVASDEMTKTVVLTHTPKETGLYDYHVVVEPMEVADRKREALAENNERTVSVAVSDERTNVLIIEGRPRWEFRYLRNLLADRDKSVRLQSVLMAPDQIAELPPSKSTHASVARSREAGKTEAKLPPKDKAEWLKFDVIVLGDVPPTLLRNEVLKTLSEFVHKRGGTLITIAGPNYMPHAYDKTPLKELLPIIFSPETRPLLYGPEPQFRWGLTAAGRTHPIMKQTAGTGQEKDFWKSLPPFFWRHEIRGVKPGATVLSYASTRKAEIEFSKTDGLDAGGREALLEKQKAFERKNALVVTQSYGIGRVLALNTDRTWRMRYRVGDTHHHRFWGQILRWAVSEKLQAGTNLVRLGTDQLLYAKGDPVIVRARITDKSYSPVVDEKAKIKVYQEDRLLLTKKLEFVPDSNGYYEVNIGELPGGEGVYRLELDSPLANELLASDGVSKLETRVTVLPPASQISELIELSTNRTALSELARHGSGQMVEVNEVGSLLELLGPPSDPRSEKEAWRFRLWDTWPMLLMMGAVVTIEWILRKKAGLA